VIDEITGPELDLALGRPNVIHAAVAAGPGSDGFLARWRRLRAYRGTGADEAALLAESGRALGDAQNADDEPAGI
jgi:hypothetical protein